MGKKREGCTYLGPAELFDERVIFSDHPLPRRSQEGERYEFNFSIDEPTKVVPFAPMEGKPCFSISMLGSKWVILTQREVNDSRAFDAVAALHRQRSRR